jgi:hypothetical protein
VGGTPVPALVVCVSRARVTPTAQPPTPTPEWLTKVHRDIERHDVFLAVMTPEWLETEARISGRACRLAAQLAPLTLSAPCGCRCVQTCTWQVDYALRCGKRIVPVVRRPVDYNAVRLELAAITWVFSRLEGGFATRAWGRFVFGRHI